MKENLTLKKKSKKSWGFTRQTLIGFERIYGRTKDG